MRSASDKGRGSLPAGRIVAGAALAVVLGALWGLLGPRHALTVALVLVVPVLAVWGLRRHPRGTAVVALTTMTPVVVLWISATSANDPGVAWVTVLGMALASPLGAWLVPVRRGARWLTVGVTDAALVMIAAVGPAVPAWTPALALAALVGPLAAQTWRRKALAS